MKPSKHRCPYFARFIPLRRPARFTMPATALFVGTALLGGGHSAQAATDTYTNPTGLFSTGFNNTPANGDTLVFGALPSGSPTTISDDIASLTVGGTSTDGIDFTASSAGYTINPSGTTQTITLNSSGTGFYGISDLTTSAVTISVPLILAKSQTINVGDAAGSLTLSGAISGGFGLTKIGAGTLTLSGANTYTGATSISAGKVILGVSQNGTTSGPLGAGTATNTLTMGGGGTLDLAGNNALVSTLTANSTSGTSTLTSSAAATLTITSGNNLSGLTITGAASILLSGGTTLGTIPSSNFITGTGSFGLQNQAAGTYFKDSSIGAHLGANGSLLFNGSGGFQNSGASNLAAGNGVIINGTGNQWSIAQSITANGAVTGSGSLLFTNGNTSTYTVTFNGSFTGFHGTLGLLGSNSGQGLSFSNTTTYSNDANWTLNSVAPTTAANVLSYFNATGTGNKTIILGSLSGSVTAGTGAGSANVGYGVLNNSQANTTATWQIGGANADTTFAGVIQNGTGTLALSALTKVGTGNLTLSGVNTYTGATSITGGTLTLAATKTISVTSGIAVGSTATLSLTAANALNTPGATTSTTVGSPVSVAGQVPISLGGGTLQRNGTGVSLGSQSGTTGTVGIGMLTLTAASSLDFGASGTTGVGTLNFNGFSDSGNFVLTVTNYTHTTAGTGVDGTDDRLTFNQDMSGFLTDFLINGQQPSQLALGNGEYELVLTAVPEPSTWVAGLVCIGTLGFVLRRRLAGASPRRSA